MLYVKLFMLLILLVLLAALGGLAVWSPGPFSSSPEDSQMSKEIEKPLKEIESPYQEVNWETSNQYRANLHTHTSKSGGDYSPAEVIDMYRKHNYRVLAITDHNRVTWPWEKYHRHPNKLNMVAVPANELSNTHHLGSYFSSFKSSSTSENRLLKGIADKDGLAVFYHPGRYDYESNWYLQYFQDYPHLVGMEIINRDDRYPGDRKLWDKVLHKLMPERPVWGFASDDMHKSKHLGTSCSIFLMDEPGYEQAREVMEEGRFYAVLGPNPPKIESMKIERETSAITLEASNHTAIKWISGGEIIYRGETLYLEESLPRSAYVRAKVEGEKGKALTNPLGLYFK